MKLTQAVILAGGQGTRMQPYTFTNPKPMIQVNGKPFLEYLIVDLKKNGIKEVIILTGYLHEKIEDYFKDGRKFGIHIKYSYSPIEAETGTRIKNALPLFKSTFLLMYGDNYWPLDLSELTTFYSKKKKSMSVTVFSNKDNYSKNNMYIDQSGMLKVYDKTKTNILLNGVDIGYFIINKKILTNLPNENFSFEKQIISKQIEKNDIAGFLTNHKYYGLSNPGRISLIEKFLKPRKVVFLDRDGVINKRAPKAEYITSWSDFEVLPHVRDALKLLKKKRYEIYVVSNQAGIARGVVTRKTIDGIHKRFLALAKRWGVVIDGIYICPHGWNDGCWCRKPSPGMFFEVSYDHAINLFESYCIGDDERDIVAGKAAHCKKTFMITPEKDLYTIVKENL